MYFKNFHKKTPVLEYLFNKVAGLRTCNVIKKRLQIRCFPVKFEKSLKTSILKNIYKRLLLSFVQRKCDVEKATFLVMAFYEAWLRKPLQIQITIRFNQILHFLKKNRGYQSPWKQQCHEHPVKMFRRCPGCPRDNLGRSNLRLRSRWILV